MELWTLIENSSSTAQLRAEHGLSLYLKVNGQIVLFDAGQTDSFVTNAEQLGLDLAEADLAVLSHGHYDHSGGLLAFLERNSTAKVYVNPHVFEPHYNALDKDIGVDPRLQQYGDRLCFAGDGQVIGEGLTLFSCNSREPVVPICPYGLSMEQEGERLPEDFRHEQYLWIEEGQKRILISGCSHKGILNLVHWFWPDVLVGGFHFMKLDPDHPQDAAVLEQSARQLLAYPTVYYTGHCTGERQFSFLKERMGDRLHPISAGYHLVL